MQKVRRASRREVSRAFPDRKNSLEANYFNEFHAASFSRKRVPRERGAGGPASDRPDNTGLGDRDPGGPRRVPEYLPIRVDPRGSLLPGHRTDTGHNRRRKLRTSVPA